MSNNHIFFDQEAGFIQKQVRGDRIQVKLMDTTYNVYFEAKAHINNKKEMSKLKDDLKAKGVSFDEDGIWF